MEVYPVVHQACAGEVMLAALLINAPQYIQALVHWIRSRLTEL
jgi:hypothetical protein